MGFPPTTFIKLKRWGWVAEITLSKGIEAAGKQVPAPDLKMEPQTRWVDPERFWQRPDPRECGLSDKSDGTSVGNPKGRRLLSQSPTTMPNRPQ